MDPDKRNEAVEPQRVVQEIVAGFSRSGPAYHPVFDRFGPEHVTQFLKQTHEQDIGEQQLRKSNRWFRFAYVLSGIFVFVFLTMFLLPDQADLYLRILEYFGVFAAGIAGGYGLKAYQDSRQGS